MKFYSALWRLVLLHTSSRLQNQLKLKVRAHAAIIAALKKKKKKSFLAGFYFGCFSSVGLKIMGLHILGELGNLLYQLFFISLFFPRQIDCNIGDESCLLDFNRFILHVIVFLCFFSMKPAI